MVHLVSGSGLVFLGRNAVIETVAPPAARPRPLESTPRASRRLCGDGASSDGPTSFARRNRTKYRYDRIGDALADIEAAEKLAPGDADVQYALATLRAIHNDVEGSIAALRRALAAGWGHPEYTREDPDFESVRSHPDYGALLGPR